MLPIRQILCPTDFSALSQQAVVAAYSLASRFNAQLHLLHVVTPVQAVYPMAPLYGPMPLDVDECEAALRDAARQQLAEIVAHFQLDSAHVRTSVCMGSPADEIVEVAAKENADLIVIATHGHTGWRHLVFGSVAERVMCLAQCPVFIVPGTQKHAAQPVSVGDLAIRKVVCPTDFSAESYRGLYVAEEWANRYQAELILVHVVEPLGQYSSLVIDVSDIEQTMETDAAKELYRLVHKCVSPTVRARYVIRHGHAAQEIVAAAQEANADLIVTSTHGRTGWRHLAFGSVAEPVIRLAHCPVLTIRSVASDQHGVAEGLPNMRRNSQQEDIKLPRENVK